MLQKMKGILAMAGALVLVGAGCAQSGTTMTNSEVPKSTEKIKVGLEMPLTGDVASYGIGIKKAVDLALKELNLSNVELVYEDSQCKGNMAVGAMTKMVNEDKVVAVVGDLCSAATLAAAPVAEQNRVVMISPGSTAPTISNAGDYIFRVIPSDSYQAVFGAKYLYEKGYKKMAISYTNEDYGSGFNTVLKEEFPKLGGTIVASEAVESGSTELRTTLTKIKNANPDVVYFVYNNPATIVAALKQAKELGIKAVLVGSEAFKSDEVLKGAKGATEGVLVTYPHSSVNQAFVDAHKAMYQAEPGTFAAQGYDAMMAIGRAIKAGATTGEEIKNKLYADEFDGVSGRIKFDANGDVAGTYDVLVVKGGKFETVQ